MIDTVQQALIEAYSSPFGTDWNGREEIAFASIKRAGSGLSPTIERQNVFLGGDILRPYLSVHTENELWIAALENQKLSRPKLLAQLESGVFGPFTRGASLPTGILNTTVCNLTNSDVTSRLVVPNLYLTTLTNGSRYQSRRYPLNVARLAQWARFQHAARVRAVDLALTFNGNIGLLAADIAQSSPDILGISLNFGELDSFSTLMMSLREIHSTKPVVCVGNVLAAWAREEVQKICDGFKLLISESYGEVLLEQLCETVACRSRGDRASPTVDAALSFSSPALYPAAIVYPDDRLLAQTLDRAGQPAIETSFGCQYGRCSFCPRDHRSRGWRRRALQDSTEVIRNIAAQLASLPSQRDTILSIVDEDAFGSEGLDPRRDEPSIVKLVNVASSHGVACEIYTRAEQIFNPRWKRSDSINRLRQLAQMQPWLGRVFVGVESGSNTQLQRYAKGQTVEDVVYALRAGSLLNLPLEFGFITFDPLLTELELVESLIFLARRDVLLPPDPAKSLEDTYSLVMSNSPQASGDPLFARVAYMATELELFAGSDIASQLKKTHAHLIKHYDASFARYHYDYADSRIGQIAAWCRVWTEGTFRPMYRMRLAGRTDRKHSCLYQRVIRRHREATFALLVVLTAQLSKQTSDQLSLAAASVDSIPMHNGRNSHTELNQLRELWAWVICDSGVARHEEADFRPEHLEKRRDA